MDAAEYSVASADAAYGAPRLDRREAPAISSDQSGQMEKSMARSTHRRRATPRLVRRGRRQAWKLEDAKARFSEVVRLARSMGPQHVTVRGQDAVVVLSTEDFAALMPSAHQPSLHALLSESPLSRVHFPHAGRPMPVRDVPL